MDRDHGPSVLAELQKSLSSQKHIWPPGAKDWSYSHMALRFWIGESRQPLKTRHVPEEIYDKITFILHGSEVAYIQCVWCMLQRCTLQHFQRHQTACHCAIYFICSAIQAMTKVCCTALHSCASSVACLLCICSLILFQNSMQIAFAYETVEKNNVLQHAFSENTAAPYHFQNFSPFWNRLDLRIHQNSIDRLWNYTDSIWMHWNLKKSNTVLHWDCNSAVYANFAICKNLVLRIAVKCKPFFQQVFKKWLHKTFCIVPRKVLALIVMETHKRKSQLTMAFFMD